jgi:uncharacterized protein (TIGR02001 family)
MAAGLISSVIGCVSAIAQTAPAAAPAPDSLKFAYNVGVASDYVFRGFSQTRRGPSLQGGVDATYGIFYAGVAAMSTNFNTATDPYKGLPFSAGMELDVYGGIKPVLKTSVGDFNFDLGAIYYTYPTGTSPNANLNYAELKAGVSKELWKDGTLSAMVYYSPNYQLSTNSAWTGEIGLAQNLAAIGKVVPSVSVLYGYQKGHSLGYQVAFTNGAKGYSYWNGGVTFTYDEKWSLDLRYWDTNLKNNNAASGFSDSFCSGSVFQCTSRAVATLKYTF